MRPTVVTVGPLAAAVANNIATSQTPTAAITLDGSLVTGGVAVLDTPRRVLITMNGNEVGKTFTLTGTNWAGDPISESIAGVSGSTAASVLDYKTVTTISISSAAASTLTVGTNGVAASAWIRFDEWADPTTAIQVVVSGTVNYTVQQTLDDPNSPTNPVLPAAMTWVSCPVSALVGATSTQQSFTTYPPAFARVLLNSGTGSITATFTQMSVVQG